MRLPTRTLATASVIALSGGLLAACGAASPVMGSSSLPGASSAASLDHAVARLAHTYAIAAAKEGMSTLYVGTSTAQCARAVELSPPLMVDGRLEAVAAFPYAPDGKPVEVLAFARSAWSVIERLPGAIDYAHGGRSVLLTYPGKIRIGHLAGLEGPALLIRVAGGGCYAGALLAPTGIRLHYLRVAQVSSDTRLVGGDPQFFHQTLITTSDCGATSASMGNTMTFWRWSARRGLLLPASTTAIPPRDKQALLEGRL